MLVFGGLMSIGSAAFVTANWAMTTDVVPAARAGRLLGLANVGTAGAAAVAGLFGPVADVARAAFPGSGYASVFIGAVVPIALSIIVARPLSRLESPRPHSARPPSVREPTLASAQPAGRLLR